MMIDGKDFIKGVLRTFSPFPWETEYVFIPGRKFRADFYVPALNLLIEYEGIMSAKSRHTSVKGYTNDCIKYNLASMMGFTVLRYTVMNVSDFEEHLKMLVKRNLK